MVVVLFCKSPMKKIIIMNRERSWGGAATQKAANNKCIKKREREREREREKVEVLGMVPILLSFRLLRGSMVIVFLS
jgi:hypothetical protein